MNIWSCYVEYFPQDVINAGRVRECTGTHHDRRIAHCRLTLTSPGRDNTLQFVTWLVKHSPLPPPPVCFCRIQLIRLGYKDGRLWWLCCSCRKKKGVRTAGWFAYCRLDFSAILCFCFLMCKGVPEGLPGNWRKSAHGVV